MAVLTRDIIEEYKKAFYLDDKNVFAQNVCSRNDPTEVCLSRKTIQDTQHVFSHKIELEGKPVTNQKSSGRCWLFAALNVMRLPFMKHLNIDEFEFSQAYMFVWDKIERCNHFLHNVVEATKRNESVDGRLMAFLLRDPIEDGGQWDMFVNLVNKYGVMPKKCFPETFCCEMSVRVNQILKSKLREYAKNIRDLIAKGGSDADVQGLIKEQMKHLYRIVSICLGTPNETFTWSYYDKNKAYHSIGPITPKDFYEQHVKPVFDVNDKVCLVTDPRPTNAYGKLYTIDLLGNVNGGSKCIYNNQPVELLIELTAKSLQAGEAVWFGCDVSKRASLKNGIQDLKVHDYPLVLGVDIQDVISKADRLIYGESCMTHAMVFTAVNINEKGEVTKFRVENSWGDEKYGEKGYLVMTAEWFKEFTFEVVVDKKYVPQEVLDIFQQEPIVLPAWDPMGTLAKSC